MKQHTTGGAVGQDADPSSTLTSELPSLSRGVASNDELVTWASHPRIIRWNQVGTANSCTAYEFIHNSNICNV